MSFFLSTRFSACTSGITAISRSIFSGKSARCFRSPGFFYRFPPVTFATVCKNFFCAGRYAKTPCKNAAAFSNQPSASLPSAFRIRANELVSASVYPGVLFQFVFGFARSVGYAAQWPQCGSPGFSQQMSNVNSLSER